MSIDITLPQLGVEMKSALLAEWVRKDGDEVDGGEVIAIIETDKVSYEIEAPTAGVLHTAADVDQEYKVGARLGAVSASRKEYLAVARGTDTHPDPPTSGTETTVQPERRVEQPPASTAAAERSTNGIVLATPLARRVAADAGMDISTIEGSGRRGQIRRRDVEAAQAQDPAAQDEPHPVSEPVDSPQPSDSPNHEQGKPLSAMRRTIADRMQQSLQTTAQLTDVREVEVSALVELRNRLAAKAERIGFKVSFTDLFLKATALALREVPELNVTVQADRIIEHDHVHLGMAVSVPDGLIVPVVRDADQLSLRAIHQRSEEAALAARERKVTAADLTGGTFTVTNIGSYGSHFGTPVLNLPQVAILATGAILDRPVVRDGEVRAGKVVHLSLTVDHRIIDGELAGRFHNTMAALLAEPDRLLVG
ncbi:dihydrolipoyllysine-residue succinyltransferase (plasmid) [Rhodococcus jostii RHA1]|uniref:Dihydrolipoamide acetyltransferase component of pyruvate dehydrogenase complex n=1 Tax=Rhodococcus jostii (strain RHA1) TaxID=101510 RepID=Q0RVL0_RHOJR|nr:dihydrolipoamide acetyltransferase family protein [Rhodococcus jostii]ABH00676.1 dihydrolipoyllysine-residue succinyltransferase [Rhodococcus jostii RHA1]